MGNRKCRSSWGEISVMVRLGAFVAVLVVLAALTAGAATPQATSE